ncbi:MAG: IS21 family transposase [Bacillota bacterium]
MQGKSIRWIARELKMSRKTIRKALKDALPPTYNLTRQKPKPVTGTIQPIVEQWLAADEAKPKKQRHTANRIYERLVQEYGYQGSKASIHMLVHKLRQKERETYVPLSFEPGTNAQCDWGTVTVILAGEPVKVELFALRLTNSRFSFCQAFPSTKQEAFFEGHRRAFDFFGGAPLTITYDNLKTAVFKILEGRTRIEQQAFIAFRSHYLFESIYCNAGRGNEKGQVENLIMPKETSLPPSRKQTLSKN